MSLLDGRECVEHRVGTIFESGALRPRVDPTRYGEHADTNGAQVRRSLLLLAEPTMMR